MVVLNGKDLTIEEVFRVVEGEEVRISDESLELLAEARQLVFDLVDQQVPIYGFNVGVGWNKDRAVFKDFFQKYNTNVILSHSFGVGDYLDEKTTRAVLLLRLNAYLVGCTGAQVEVIQYYETFLNKKIHPAIPEKGSVGVSDLGNVSHIGLAMIGEGEVYYKGELISAKEALELAELEPVNLGPKDGLAIVSSNSHSAGITMMLIKETRELLKTANLVFSLSLEALNGNTSPFLEEPYKRRPYSFNIDMANEIRENIKGSSIWNFNPNKPVQDPLSFRDAAHVHGAVKGALDYLEELIMVQMNSSDDNPCLLLEERKIVSCANYEPISWVLAVEMLGQALAQLSSTSCHRMIKLVNPDFTGLPRFFSPSESVLGFASMQKAYASLNAEIRLLSNPVNNDYLALAGDIEDRGTNAALVAQKTLSIVDNLNRILGIEAYIAAQGVDLRLKKDHILADKTKVAYEKIRKVTPFYDKDRAIYKDLEKMYQLIKSKELIK